jgi:hypothetical protein
LKSKTDILEALGKSALPADKTKLEEYRTDKEEIQKLAGEKQTEAQQELKTHQVFAKSVTLFQIAISISAIAVLTKRPRFWYISLGLGVTRLAFFIQAVALVLKH